MEAGTINAADFDISSLPNWQRRTFAPCVLGWVSSTMSVPISDIHSVVRYADVVQARDVASWLFRKVCCMSFPETAKLMDRANHSTIVATLKRCEKIPDRRARCEEAERRFVRFLYVTHIRNRPKYDADSWALDLQDTIRLLGNFAQKGHVVTGIEAARVAELLTHLATCPRQFLAIADIP